MSKACSEAGEMAQCRKRLLQKHEALSSDPQHLRKPVMVAPSPGIPVLRVKGGDEPLGLPGPASLAEMLSCGFSEKPCLKKKKKKNKLEGNRERYSIIKLISGPRMPRYR